MFDRVPCPILVKAHFDESTCTLRTSFSSMGRRACCFGGPRANLLRDNFPIPRRLARVGLVERGTGPAAPLPPSLSHAPSVTAGLATASALVSFILWMSSDVPLVGILRVRRLVAVPRPLRLGAAAAAVRPAILWRVEFMVRNSYWYGRQSLAMLRGKKGKYTTPRTKRANLPDYPLHHADRGKRPIRYLGMR